MLWITEGYTTESAEKSFGWIHMNVRPNFIFWGGILVAASTSSQMAESLQYNKKTHVTDQVPTVWPVQAQWTGKPQNRTNY